MITPNNEPTPSSQDIAHVTLTQEHSEQDHRLILHKKFITHHVKAGLNPIVDAAAYLFSIIGKLKKLSTYRNLAALQQELIAEINHFQETTKAQGYSAEYILVTRYALCSTFDDLITNTPWGGQGQWDNYSLLTTFNQELGQQERFFLILERLIKDPALYIDVMEFMYICLSLGFKGNYRATEFSNNQLEQITHALYKRIRAYHGEINKTLSPLPVRPTVAPVKPVKAKTSYSLVALTTLAIIILMFIGLGYLLDSTSKQTNQELMQLGKAILYETHDQNRLA